MSLIKKHYLYDFTQKDENLFCDICKYKFSSISNYNKHLKFVKVLKQNNLNFIKELSDKGFDTLDFKIELFNSGSTFFSNKYNK